MNPSGCQHEWVKDTSNLLGTKLCLWCGLPQVRTSRPVPRLKIPPGPKAEPSWANRKYSSKDYSK